MTLLELAHVSKRYGRGAGERVALEDVSLQIEAGEMVAVWGARRSGRSTLLRVAAGLDRPDEGIVSIEGHDLAQPGSEPLRGSVRYCRKTFNPDAGDIVLEQLMTGELTRGKSLAEARLRAREVLKRVGAERCASLRPGELDGAEMMRVALARALVRRPKVLVIDEPALGVDLLVRDEILDLLRSLADEGIAVLASASDAAGLAGADRALSLSDGRLRGELEPPGLAPVVRLRSAAGGSPGL
jgi:ABC-type multidrug transport system ATPase subunit